MIDRARIDDETVILHQGSFFLEISPGNTSAALVARRRLHLRWCCRYPSWREFHRLAGSWGPSQQPILFMSSMQRKIFPSFLAQPTPSQSLLLLPHITPAPHSNERPMTCMHAFTWKRSYCLSQARIKRMKTHRINTHRRSMKRNTSH